MSKNQVIFIGENGQDKDREHSDSIFYRKMVIIKI